MEHLTAMYVVRKANSITYGGGRLSIYAVHLHRG